MENKIRISVRNIVEFILREGDIDSGGYRTSGDMQEGSRIHRKLQKAEGSGYLSEVSLKLPQLITYEGEEIELILEGRADGIFKKNIEDCPGYQSVEASEGSEELVIIDEIKTTLADVQLMERAYPLHRAQALCYAAMYLKNNSEPRMGIRMTYCNQETLDVKYFYEYFSADELNEWLEKLINEYSKWAVWQIKWERKRNASILASAFPFEYRKGQKKLVGDVYRTINREKNLFIEAPTGVGKTISVTYPAVYSMGEGKTGKIFYTTAKTIARTVAEEAASLLVKRGINFKSITITAKEKICILEKPECNPHACERARGHFDRINDAIYDMLTHESSVDRGLIEEYAKKHMVCPFEMCLDVSMWCDMVICDYNYVFDPRVHLKRYFEAEEKTDYVLLVDEAHNLVDRAREMYSASVTKETFLSVKNLLTPGIAAQYPKNSPKGRIAAQLNACNKAMLALKRECEGFTVLKDCATVCVPFMHFAGVYEEEVRHMSQEDAAIVAELYFDVKHFLAMYDLIKDNYTIYADYSEKGEFVLRLQCMDPSEAVRGYLERVRSAVFFSATLLPIRYYVDQLGGTDEDYSIYAPSPFDPSKRLLLVAKDVSTKYTRRTASEYERIAEYIKTVCEARVGNYLVFFPSYQMLKQIGELLETQLSGIRLQKQSMTEQEKEEFLESFEEEPKESNIGFGVMGGIFSEGIDLKADRLIGVIVVGTGLPMVCSERELFRNYFDEANSMGFEYAYLYGGMNKVMQSAGRVIRTEDDRGVIVLLDERFLNRQYLELFPKEWDNFQTTTIGELESKIKDFWES